MEKLYPHLRFVACTSNLPNKRHTVAMDCRFLYILSGNGKIHTDNGELSLHTDELLYYPSGIKYLLKSEGSEPMKFITVNFDFTNEYPGTDVLAPVYAEDCDYSLVQYSHKDFGEARFMQEFVFPSAEGLRAHFLRLNEIYHDRGEYADALTSSILRVIILEIMNNKNQPMHKTVSEAIAFIRENFRKHLTNVSIAAELKYHPYYLGALFRRYLSTTPKEYLDTVRLTHASELLGISDKSIYEIAESCGFKTAEHFTKRFKLRYGISPTEWRKRRRLI